MAIGASSQHTLCPGDEVGKPQLTRVRSMVLYCYFQSLAVANQAPNFNNYAAINREYNELIVIVCESERKIIASKNHHRHWAKTHVFGGSKKSRRVKSEF